MSTNERCGFPGARWQWPLAAILCISCLAWVARADDAVNGPSGYEEAVAQAITELSATNYPEAREEFRRAHALFPNARTLRGLGMVEFELRNYGECVRLLDEALASSIKPLDERLRADTEGLLTRARRYLGEVHVETEPTLATVTVDGTSMALGPGGSILLEVGEHTLEVQAPGRNPERRVVQVKGGERTHLRVSLAPLQPASETRAQAGRADGGPVYKKWWLWTIVGVDVVGAGVTAAVLLTRESGESEPNDPGQTGVRLQTLTRF